MAEARANGVTLHYDEQGRGPSILCIHGSGGSAMTWTGAVSDLAARGRTITYDRRGCTRSERPEPFVTDVHQHADDAAALIEVLDARPATVIGRSYGGEVAIDLALRHPGLVRALALLEGVPTTMTDAGRRWSAELDQRVLAAAETDVGTVAEALIGFVLDDDAWQAFPPPTQAMFTANGPAIVAEVRGGPLEVRPDQLAAIACPVLLVAGRDSPAAFGEATERAAESIPAARVEWVDGGHLVDPAHPAVLAFLDEVLAAG